MSAIFHKVIDFYWGRGIAYVAPALAFYLLLLLPALLLGFAALGSLLFPDEISAARITPLLAENFAPDVRAPIERFARAVFSAPAFFLALPLMVWTLSAVLSMIERIMSLPPSGSWNFIRGRIRLLWISACIVALLAIMLVLLALVSLSWSPLLFLPLLFLAVLFLYKFLPPQRPSWREAGEGALPAALLLLLSPRILSFYIDAAKPSLASGLVATLLLLLSAYLLAIALLLGAGIASRRTHTL